MNVPRVSVVVQRSDELQSRSVVITESLNRALRLACRRRTFRARHAAKVEVVLNRRTEVAGIVHDGRISVSVAIHIVRKCVRIAESRLVS